MSLDCFCDYDGPDVHRSRIVAGKKEYRCYECNRTIAAGERHEYVFAVQYGDTYQPRTCMDCRDIRAFVTNSIPCFCWAHGNLHDDVRNILEEAYRQVPDEVRGVRFGLGRLVVKAKRARQLA